jgi:hypothetical protein
VIKLDLLTHGASYRGETVHMRPAEYRLLTYLALNHDRVLSHQELLDNVWGADRCSLASLKWHVSALREKFETDPKKPRPDSYLPQGWLPLHPSVKTLHSKQLDGALTAISGVFPPPICPKYSAQRDESCGVESVCIFEAARGVAGVESRVLHPENNSGWTVHRYAASRARAGGNGTGPP